MLQTTQMEKSDSNSKVNRAVSDESGYSSSNESDQVDTHKEVHSPTPNDVSAGALDCLTKNGNKVTMLVNMNGPDMFMAVNGQKVVVLSKADLDSQNVSFNWIHLTDTDYGIKLENDSYTTGAVVGIEKFVNDTPLTLQHWNNKGDNSNCILYRRGSSKNEYFALCFKSPDNNFFYVLPSGVNSPLKIYSTDQVKEFKDRNLYVFQATNVVCSNATGACPFKRLQANKEYT